MRSPNEVAERLFALIAISSAAHEQPPNGIRAWIEENNFKHTLSPDEMAFLYENAPSQNQLTQASWRSEGVPVLLWALGSINELPPASVAADWAALGIDGQFMSEVSSYISSAQLRAESDLVAMQDRLHSMHWGVRAGPSGRRLFSDPNHDENAIPGVVYERHYAINWLLDGEEWDNVQTDT